MEKKEQQGVVSDEQTLSLLYFAAHAGFWTVAPFLRSSMGRRAGGMAQLVAMGVLLWWAGQTRSEAMTFYVWSWTGMATYRWLTPGEQGQVIAEYQGRPFMTLWLVRDELLARLAEIPLVFLAGAAVADASAAIGTFLMWASLALAIKYWIESTYLRRLEEAEDDAILLMQSRMARRNRR